MVTNDAEAVAAKEIMRTKIGINIFISYLFILRNPAVSC